MDKINTRCCLIVGIEANVLVVKHKYVERVLYTCNFDEKNIEKKIVVLRNIEWAKVLKFGFKCPFLFICEAYELGDFLSLFVE